MLDDPERRVCPLCKRSSMSLIATITGERALDIYLCPECREQFSYRHPDAQGAKTSEAQPIAPVKRVLDVEPS
jgi:transposase-like protein